MKYGQYWKKELKTLPSQVQKHIIDYKCYKKLIKTSVDSTYIMNKLMEDAKKADMFFKKSKNECDGLFKMAELNSTSLYKICKKTQKKNKDNYAMAWLQYVHNKHMFAFVSGIKKTQLSIHNTESKECPICFEESNNVIIMHCGHILCLDCVKNMLNVQQKRGTIYNLIAHGLYSIQHRPSCPFCRHKKALCDYEIVKIK